MPTHTVDTLSRLVYAIAPAGDYPEYEARISPDGSEALLLADKYDSTRPDIEWHEADWAREQTAGWETNSRPD